MGAIYWKNNCRDKESQISELQAKHKLPKAICAILAARGISSNEVQSFLNPKLANLSDPYRFPGIVDAAKRLWDAVINKEPILIHGDYDTDGITASALLSLVLRTNGANVFSFIPHSCRWDLHRAAALQAPQAGWPDTLPRSAEYAWCKPGRGLSRPHWRCP